MSARLMSLRPLSTRLVFVLLALIVMATAGCRSAPIRDEGPTQIHTSASKEQIRSAIGAAGASLGWAMKEQSPGLIIGTLAVRDHLAVVEIPYSTRSFSIRYKDSRNLKFNATDNTIHKNYNSWIANLNNAIVAQVSAL